MNTLKYMLLLSLLFHSVCRAIEIEDDLLVQAINEEQYRLRLENQQQQQQLQAAQQLLQHLQAQIQRLKNLQHSLSALAHPCSSCATTLVIPNQ